MACHRARWYFCTALVMLALAACTGVWANDATVSLNRFTERNESHTIQATSVTLSFANVGQLGGVNGTVELNTPHGTLALDYYVYPPVIVAHKTQLGFVPEISQLHTGVITTSETTATAGNRALLQPIDANLTDVNASLVLSPQTEGDLLVRRRLLAFDAPDEIVCSGADESLGKDIFENSLISTASPSTACADRPDSLECASKVRVPGLFSVLYHDLADADGRQFPGSQGSSTKPKRSDFRDCVARNRDSGRAHLDDIIAFKAQSHMISQMLCLEQMDMFSKASGVFENENRRTDYRTVSNARPFGRSSIRKKDELQAFMREYSNFGIPHALVAAVDPALARISQRHNVLDKFPARPIYDFDGNEILTQGSETRFYRDAWNVSEIALARKHMDKLTCSFPEVKRLDKRGDGTIRDQCLHYNPVFGNPDEKNNPPPICKVDNGLGAPTCVPDVRRGGLSPFQKRPVGGWRLETNALLQNEWFYETKSGAPDCPCATQPTSDFSYTCVRNPEALFDFDGRASRDGPMYKDSQTGSRIAVNGMLQKCVIVDASDRDKPIGLCVPYIVSDLTVPRAVSATQTKEIELDNTDSYTPLCKMAADAATGAILDETGSTGSDQADDVIQENVARGACAYLSSILPVYALYEGAREVAGWITSDPPPPKVVVRSEPDETIIAQANYQATTLLAMGAELEKNGLVLDKLDKNVLGNGTDAVNRIGDSANIALGETAEWLLQANDVAGDIQSSFLLAKAADELTFNRTINLDAQSKRFYSGKRKQLMDIDKTLSELTLEQTGLASDLQGVIRADIAQANQTEYWNRYARGIFDSGRAQQSVVETSFLQTVSGRRNARAVADLNEQQRLRVQQVVTNNDRAAPYDALSLRPFVSDWNPRTREYGRRRDRIIRRYEAFVLDVSHIYAALEPVPGSAETNRLLFQHEVRFVCNINRLREVPPLRIREVFVERIFAGNGDGCRSVTGAPRNESSWVPLDCICWVEHAFRGCAVNETTWVGSTEHLLSKPDSVFPFAQPLSAAHGCTEQSLFNTTQFENWTIPTAGGALDLSSYNATIFAPRNSSVPDFVVYGTFAQWQGFIRAVCEDPVFPLTPELFASGTAIGTRPLAPDAQGPLRREIGDNRLRARYPIAWGGTNATFVQTRNPLQLAVLNEYRLWTALPNGTGIYRSNVGGGRLWTTVWDPGRCSTREADLANELISESDVFGGNELYDKEQLFENSSFAANLTLVDYDSPLDQYACTGDNGQPWIYAVTGQRWCNTTRADRYMRDQRDRANQTRSTTLPFYMLQSVMYALEYWYSSGELLYVDELLSGTVPSLGVRTAYSPFSQATTTPVQGVDRRGAPLGGTGAQRSTVSMLATGHVALPVSAIRFGTVLYNVTVVARPVAQDFQLPEDMTLEEYLDGWELTIGEENAAGNVRVFGGDELFVDRGTVSPSALTSGEDLIMVGYVDCATEGCVPPKQREADLSDHVTYCRNQFLEDVLGQIQSREVFGNVSRAELLAWCEQFVQHKTFDKRHAVSSMWLEEHKTSLQHIVMSKPRQRLDQRQTPYVYDFPSTVLPRSPQARDLLYGMVSTDTVHRMRRYEQNPDPREVVAFNLTDLRVPTGLRQYKIRNGSRVVREGATEDVPLLCPGPHQWRWNYSDADIRWCAMYDIEDLVYQQLRRRFNLRDLPAAVQIPIDAEFDPAKAHVDMEQFRVAIAGGGQKQIGGNLTDVPSARRTYKQRRLAPRLQADDALFTGPLGNSSFAMRTQASHYRCVQNRAQFEVDGMCDTLERFRLVTDPQSHDVAAEYIATRVRPAEVARFDHVDTSPVMFFEDTSPSTVIQVTLRVPKTQSLALAQQNDPCPRDVRVVRALTPRASLVMRFERHAPVTQLYRIRVQLAVPSATVPLEQPRICGAQTTNTSQSAFYDNRALHGTWWTSATNLTDDGAEAVLYFTVGDAADKTDVDIALPRCLLRSVTMERIIRSKHRPLQCSLHELSTDAFFDHPVTAGVVETHRVVGNVFFANVLNARGELADDLVRTQQLLLRLEQNITAQLRPVVSLVASSSPSRSASSGATSSPSANNNSAASPGTNRTTNATSDCSSADCRAQGDVGSVCRGDSCVCSDGFVLADGVCAVLNDLFGLSQDLVEFFNLSLTAEEVEAQLRLANMSGDIQALDAVLSNRTDLEQEYDVAYVTELLTVAQIVGVAVGNQVGLEASETYLEVLRREFEQTVVGPRKNTTLLLLALVAEGELAANQSLSDPAALADELTALTRSLQNLSTRTVSIRQVFDATPIQFNGVQDTLGVFGQENSVRERLIAEGRVPSGDSPEMVLAAWRNETMCDMLSAAETWAADARTTSNPGSWLNGLANHSNGFSLFRHVIGISVSILLWLSIMTLVFYIRITVAVKNAQENQNRGAGKAGLNT